MQWVQCTCTLAVVSHMISYCGVGSVLGKGWILDAQFVGEQLSWAVFRGLLLSFVHLSAQPVFTKTPEWLATSRGGGRGRPGLCSGVEERRRVLSRESASLPGRAGR